MTTTSAQSADAVVIGAGHNGLVAANLLADAGWEVVVLEATAVPGGAVRSAEVTAPGYLSDLYSSFYPLGYASPVLGGLDLGRHGLSWRHAPDVLAHLLPDGRSAVINRNPDVTAASLEQFAPGDGKRWLDAYTDWLDVAEPMLEAITSPFPPVRGGLGLLRRLRVAGALRLARRLVVPVRKLGDELFDGAGGPALLAGCALHTDLSPEEAGSGVYGWLLAMLGQQVGWPVPVGGAQQITNALVGRLQERGGTILYGARVDRVLTARGRAMGVRTEGGALWRARRAVLADVPAPALYLDLVGAAALPSRLVEDLAHFRWDGSTLKVDWALSAPVPWANRELVGAGTVHLGADLNGLTHYAGELARGELPRDPFLLVGQMSVADPSHSPPGTESLWSYTHLPFRRNWRAEDVAGHVQRMEDVLEAAAPGFRRLIVGRHVAGPADLEKGNPSLVGGALGGGTAAAYQQLFLRPIPGLGRADTPVDRLFLASASAHPGGGVHGAPGANAARAALARDRALTGRAYAAAIATAHRALYPTT
ncbi:phytoene desaturase family protein [Micromonospora parathelypteridis]|uniref:Pyridine nucleotide-disulfide oxidoreductase domain-containing protein 2 n=1 Tax=Micromonospora parathelypteridis TaxID=1839617 RepID=A0A840VT63_9ACTN|nr:NAD(P)/FAD-dependent oxidoreductase [Micromonospora parathelypteridis]MBB5480352.1 phytoene dehydrogenase-like protein [Micromonospora parathelypteridis]GGO23813.1 FAD-dependent oxidoreductase [Micromonospora parathelypteridis]